jgi:mono/diheme cytochrome c family protein/thiol-disulfide isomerase/thioredoxin
MDQEQPPRRSKGSLVLVVGVGVLALALSAGAVWWLRARPHPAKGASAEARGRLVYQQHCASCHGAEGNGDGPSVAELKTVPRAFNAGPWKHAPTLDALRRVIAEGIQGTEMPGVGAALSPEDLNAVVTHVLALGRAPADELGPLLSRAGLPRAANRRETPDLELIDHEGMSSTLSARRGKFVLLVFWETTCLPCVKKLPGLERLAEEFRGQAVEIVPVCLDEGEITPLAELARAHLKSLRLHADVRGVGRLRYDIQAVPHACLLDREGRMLGSGPGAAAWDSQEVRDLLRYLVQGRKDQ